MDGNNFQKCGFVVPSFRVTAIKLSPTGVQGQPCTPVVGYTQPLILMPVTQCVGAHNRKYFWRNPNNQASINLSITMKGMKTSILYAFHV
jgi:hypothetical protein